jgi:hypothetical protein
MTPATFAGVLKAGLLAIASGNGTHRVRSEVVGAGPLGSVVGVRPQAQIARWFESATLNGKHQEFIIRFGRIDGREIELHDQQPMR